MPINPKDITWDEDKVPNVTVIGSSQAPSDITWDNEPATPKERPSLVQQAVGFGSPIQRVVKGAVVDPFWGALKMLTGGKVDAINNLAQASETATQKGREAIGSEGFDFMQLTGNVLSPLNKVLPVKGASALGTVGKMAGSGAVSAGLQPVTEGAPVEQTAQQLKQMLLGGAIGGAIGGGVAGASKAAGVVQEIVKPFTESGRTDILLARLKEIIPADKWDEVVTSLKNATELVPGSKPTAAEATANIPEATALASYQRSLGKAEGISSKFAARTAEQEAARLKQLQTLGGSADNINAAETYRNAFTARQRDEALSMANIFGETAPNLEKDIAQRTQEAIQAMQMGGKLSTEAAQQIKLAKNWFPAEGLPRISGRYSANSEQVLGNLQGAREAGDLAAQRKAEAAFKQFQFESLANEGFYPLETSPIISKIDSILATPGKGASTLVRQSLSDIRNKIAGLTDERGIINSNDLYTVRKEIGSDIQRYAKETGNWDQKLVASLDTSLKGAIDNAIEGAGGTGWKDYLKTYADMSKKIDSMKVGQTLENKLQTSIGDKERAGVFAQAMQDAAGTIKRSTGQQRYQNLSDVLSPTEVKSAESVLADLVRKETAKTAAGKTNVNISMVGKEGHQLPQFLSATATVANSVLRRIRGDANSQINQKFAGMLLNPEDLASFMSSIPPEKAGVISKVLNNTLDDATRSALFNRIGISAPGEVMDQYNSPVQQRRSVFPQNQQMNPKPQSKSEIQGLLSSVIAQKNVPPELARVIPAVVQTESSWNPEAKNKNSSAKGLFQMTNAARADVGIPRNATIQQDIEGGIDYLMKMYKKYGSVDKAIQAYNQGHYNPRSKEGKQYVASVFSNLK